MPKIKPEHPAFDKRSFALHYVMEAFPGLDAPGITLIVPKELLDSVGAHESKP